MRMKYFYSPLSVLAVAALLSNPVQAQTKAPAPTAPNSVGAGGVTPVNLQGMDIEAAMLAVQQNRANLLETQLKDQIAAVQAKNQQLSKLNTALGALNLSWAQFPRDAGPAARVGETRYKENDYRSEKEINSALLAAGVAPFTPDNGPNSARGRTLDWDKNPAAPTAYLAGGIGGDTTRAQMERAIAVLKTQIDALSNSQQMEMLRLQSLSNKRNEAFEVMTNFIKKMQESRAQIIGNMR